MVSNHQRKVLVIGTVFPEPNSSAAGSRMLQLIAIFKQQGDEVTFASIANDSDFMINLTELGINKVSIKLNDDSFDAFVKALNPKIVLFDRFIAEEHFGWRVNENCPAALRILDTEDLHCLRAARQKAYKTKEKFETLDLLTEETAKREIASILRCDLSLMISTYEMQILNDVFKISNHSLLYLPFMLPSITDVEQKQWKKFEDKSDFVFIGNFLHEPNYQAVLCLKNEIWPIIHATLPHAKMKIYGAYPSLKVTQLQQEKQGFYVMGRATDVNEVMQNARVNLAPLPFGAGLKGKLIDSMMNGTPNVSTSIAAEAMQQDLNWSGYITDDLKDFAKKAIELYQNQEKWELFRQNGVKIINQNFNKTFWTDVFVERLNKIEEDLVTHRKFNFFGNLLIQNQYNAGKFMSKWIEEKNKNN